MQCFGLVPDAAFAQDAPGPAEGESDAFGGLAGGVGVEGGCCVGVGVEVGVAAGEAEWVFGEEASGVGVVVAGADLVEPGGVVFAPEEPQPGRVRSVAGVCGVVGVGGCAW